MAKRSRPTVGAQLDEIVGGGTLDHLVNAPKVSQTVALDHLTPMSGQPRRSFDDVTLAELARSIREQGLLQPLLVRPVGQGQYEIVAGERRYRAARLAGLTEIPVLIRELTDEDARTLALVENLQREDLNPVDRVDATAQLIARTLEIPVERVPAQLSALRKHPEGEGHPQLISQVEDVFNVVGGSWRSFLVHLLPVLRYPDDVLSAMRSGRLEYTKGAVLARVQDEVQRRRLLDQALGGASLEELRASARPRATTAEHDPSTRRVLKALSDRSRLQRLPAAQQQRVKALMQELDALLSSTSTKQARRSTK